MRVQLKDFGKNLLMGNLNLINVSLPVKMFEPRSYLQKLADAWLYTNHLQVPGPQCTCPTSSALTAFTLHICKGCTAYTPATHGHAGAWRIGMPIPVVLLGCKACCALLMHGRVIEWWAPAQGCLSACLVSWA